MKFKPLNNMVLIEPIKEEKKGSIIVIKDESTHKRGVVVATPDDEDFIVVGDKVVYTDAYDPIELDGQKYHIVKKKGIYFKEV
jgi:co-chaperonin GroES (HSP10)